MVTHMDEPCDICGDIGVFDAIYTCCDCKTSREHSYCMKTLRLDIPLFWRCEECEHRNQVLSPKSGMKEDTPKAPMRNHPGIVHQYVNPGGFNKLSSHLSRSNIREKWVDKGKTKYIPCQEAIKLSSGSRKLEPTLKKTSGSGRGPSKTILKRERLPIRPNAMLPKISSKAKADPTIEVLGKSKPRIPGDVKINPIIQQAVMHSSTEIKDSKAIRHPRKRIAEIRQPSDVVKCPEEVMDTEMGKAYTVSLHCPHVPPPVTSGSNACNNVELGSSCAQNLNHKTNASEVEKNSGSIPSLHAYWKGSFKLPNSLGHLELIDGIKGHPPSRVHLKVYEALKKMPGMLEFELVPRFKVWADTFADYCPDKDDIGLYFFPCNSDSSVKYKSLLEFICTEKLVMRSSVDGVDLLVLASQVLVLDSQKWEGDHFLWGVFRRVKMDNAAADNSEELPLVVHPSDAHETHSEGGDSVAEDMDIDMIGERFVGRIDIAVPKDSSRGECENSGMETAAACISEGSVRKGHVTFRSCDSIAAQPLFATKLEPCSDIPPGFERVRSGMEIAAARILERSVSKATTSTNCISIAARPSLAIKQEPCNDIPPGFERVFS